MPPAKRRKTTRSKKPAPDEAPASESQPEVPEIPVVEEAADAVISEAKAPEAVDEVQSPTENPAAAAAASAADGLIDEPKDTPPTADDDNIATSSSVPTAKPIIAAPEAEAPATTAEDRMARFRALQARAKTSSDSNLKEAKREAQRQAANPQELASLARRHATASQKLLRAEVDEAGGDFERKRAWDWTAEESERWDRRQRKAAAHRDDVAFADYRREAQKVYKRQVREMGGPDLEAYTRERLAAVERAAAAGTLDIVETEDGELIAVDKDGSFYSTAESTRFAQNRPDKAAVDRLVNDLKRQQETADKRRRDRAAASGDDGDVTYINEKNKQFNQKLARFYNKYTAEIRESFERGTMV